MSVVFLDRYRQMHPQADLLELDAITLDTQRTFDAIYSNKVLHHLPRADFARSLRRQIEVLEPGGIAMHALWAGEHEATHGGMEFYYWTEAMVREVVPDGLEVVEVSVYTEMEPDDSLLVVLRRR